MENKSVTFLRLHFDALAIDEITRGLATGKEVIAHTDRINVSGWTGEGYIIYDPVTGAGAYKIAGGENGGWSPVVGALLAIAVLSLLFVTVGGPLLIAIASYEVEVSACLDWLGIALGSMFANLKIAQWLSDPGLKQTFYEYTAAGLSAVSDFLTTRFPSALGITLMILAHAIFDSLE